MITTTQLPTPETYKYRSRTDFEGVSLGPRSAATYDRNSAQVCIVNRSPVITVPVSASEVSNAVQAVMNACCLGANPCAGGQNKFTAHTGNGIDLSVQVFGQDCTAG